MSKLLNTVATRIQTRLSRKTLKVALGEIKDYLRSNSVNIENITKEEENNATEYFLSTATKLTVISDDVATEQTEVEETLTSEDVSSDLYINEAALTTEEETAIPSVSAAIAPATKAELIQAIASEYSLNLLDDQLDFIASHGETEEELRRGILAFLNGKYIQKEDQPAPLATTTKNELVANTAINLGIELSTTEIDQIADNFDAGSDDFSQTLEQVKGAIIAYVQHKIASNNQQIVNTINEISQVASDGFEENSQTLTNGLKQLNQQLIQQSTDFKSKLAGTLSRFKLPEAS
jgi:hypothetical protein